MRCGKPRKSSKISPVMYWFCMLMYRYSAPRRYGAGRGAPTFRCGGDASHRRHGAARAPGAGGAGERWAGGARRRSAGCHEAERAIHEINTGTYCFQASYVYSALHDLTSNNIKGEYYLTDIIGAACRAGV